MTNKEKIKQTEFLIETLKNKLKNAEDNLSIFNTNSKIERFKLLIKKKKSKICIRVENEKEVLELNFSSFKDFEKIFK